MSTPQRLPIVNSDDGTWGDIIRQFLMKEHVNDDTDNPLNGGHKHITIQAGTTTAAPITLIDGGAVLATPALGSLEYASNNLYITGNTGRGTQRQKIAQLDDSTGATAGDMYYRGATAYMSDNLVKLPIGSAGQVLTSSGTVPRFTDPNSGFKTNTQTSSYTVSSSDTVVFADATSGNVTFTLPAASGVAGYRFYIKRIDGSAHTVTIGRTGTDTIDGMTSFTLDLQYTAFAVVSNGSAWYIL